MFSKEFWLAWNTFYKYNSWHPGHGQGGGGAGGRVEHLAGTAQARGQEERLMRTEKTSYNFVSTSFNARGSSLFHFEGEMP